MFNKYMKLAVVVPCMCLLAACAPTHPGTPSFTLISGKADNVNKYYVSAGGTVEGKDCLTSVFFYLIWFGRPPVEETLLAKVLEENNADALGDAEFRSSFGFFPFIFTRNCLTVSGTPLKLKGAP